MEKTFSASLNADRVGKVKIGSVEAQGMLTLSFLQKLRDLIHQRRGQAALITTRWVSLSCHPRLQRAELFVCRSLSMVLKFTTLAHCAHWS